MWIAQSRASVELGQRYRQVSGKATWMVTGLMEDRAGNPHARLALEASLERS